MHSLFDLFNQRLTIIRNLITHRDALKIARRLFREMIGEAALLRELNGEPATERRTFAFRVGVRRARRRRVVHARSEKENAMTRFNEFSNAFNSSAASDGVDSVLI